VKVTNVKDDKIGSITLPEDTELLPGESMTLTASKEYTVAGTYKNIVSVTAVDDDNNDVVETDDASVTVTVPGGEDPQDPDEPEEPDEPDEPEESEEPEITPIDDTEVPLSGDPIQETVEPEEVIEEAIVPLATLPDTGNFFNNTILFIIGAFLLTSGIVLNKRKKIKQ
jgi:LPXTG-motif cell wall-anchored protein